MYLAEKVSSECKKYCCFAKKYFGKNKVECFLMKTVDNQLTHHGQELKLHRVMRTEANDFFRRATPAVLLHLLHQCKGKLFFVVPIDIDFNGRDHQSIVH